MNNIFVRKVAGVVSKRPTRSKAEFDDVEIGVEGEHWGKAR